MAIKFQGFTGGGGAATGGLTYKGTFNATAGTPDISNALQGDLYVIDVAGTIYGKTWAINDHLLVNADMGGAITNSKIDKVDNTSDTALQIGSNLSDLGNLATAQTNLNLKTAAYEDVGTTAGDVVQLDGTAKLPAVDGSALTNLPTAPVTSVNTATGAVNIYADDSTLNIDGTALTLSGTGATSTLNVDVGTTANKIVQLDGTAKLPAVDGSALTNLPAAPVTSVNTATGAVNIYADDTTLNIDGTALTLSGTGATSTLNVDVGTTANKIVQLDGTAKLPAVDGSALTNLPSAPVTSVNTATGAVNIYADDSTLNIDGTALTLSGTGATSTLNVDVGTTANKIVQLDGTAKLPAVDGSALTNLPTAPVTSVNTATGAVNIYADDTTLNIDGTALTLSGTGATSTLNVDVGTTANKIVQLDGTAKLPAVDGSALTNLPSAPVTSVNTATGAVNIYADDSTLNIDGTALTLSGTGATSTLNVDVGTTANKIVQLDGTAKLPAVDGSALTNLPSAPVTSVNTATGAVNIYADNTTLNIDGTALTLSGTGATSTLNVDVGTTANKIVQLDGTAKLPAVDGSALTNLPSAPVTSVNTATGAVNIYADDTTLNIDGTALTLSGTGATSTLNVDVGTTANKIVQLDGAAKIPAVDGSQLTGLPFTGLDVFTTSSNPVTATINRAYWITTLGATSVTVNLPLGSTLTDGDTLVVTRIRAGELVIAQNSGDVGTLVNYATTQAASVTIQNNYQMLTIRWNGSAWYIFDQATGTAANSDVGTSANQVVQLDGTAKLPAVDGSALTNLPSAPVTSVNTATGAVNIYADDSTLNIDGTALVLSGTGATSTLNVDVGTTANKIVQLDGTAKLPAVDGSALTNLPSAPVTSVNTATGAVNIYADDTTLNIDGTALTLSGTGATSTLNVDVGTTANKIVQLDGTAKLPAVDGSQLTNLPSSGGGWTYSAITSASSPVTSAVSYHYGADSSVGVITFNLPALSGLTGGEEIRVKLNTAGYNLNVTPNGSDTIDGSGTAYALSVALSSVTLVASNTTNWEIV